MNEDIRQATEAALGYTFVNEEHLERALTHSSLAGARTLSNERMEFLGDAVLGMVVVDSVYRRYPDMLEGEMTKIKSLVVSRNVCADVAKKLGLCSMLALGKGMRTHGEVPLSLSAAACEAIIAAIFLDGGYEAAARFIREHFDPLVDAAATSEHQHNYKSFLQQHAQRAGLSAPQYRVLDEQGPDHAKCFKICVEMGGRRFEPCWGQSKKRAEQEAALAALRELGVVEADAMVGPK